MVYARTGSPFLTALAYALTYLGPLLAGPLLAGPLLARRAERYPPRQAAITLDLTRAGLVAFMALPGMPVSGVYGLLLATMLLGAPFSAARAALLPGGNVSRPVLGHGFLPLGQAAGFLIGGGLVAVLGPHRALALDSLSFSLSAGILARGVRDRPVTRAAASAAARPSRWEISRAGGSAMFGHPVLRSLACFGWLAGFSVVLEGLAAPLAQMTGGGAATTGLLMAAVPAGLVAGVFVLGRAVRPSDRMRPDGWLAMLSCAPLLFALMRPPLPVLLLLFVLAGAGAADQFTAATAVMAAVPAASRGAAVRIARAGLLAAQGLGILAAGLIAQWTSPQAAVALAGLLGLLIAAALATSWTARQGELITTLYASQHGTHPYRTSLRHEPPQLAAAPPVPAAPVPAAPVPVIPWPAPAPRRSLHRAPRTAPGPVRLALARLLDQVLGDRAVLALLRDDNPSRQVDKHEETAGEHGKRGEHGADDVGVDTGVLPDPGADTSHYPALPGPD